MAKNKKPNSKLKGKTNSRPKVVLMFAIGLVLALLVGYAGFAYQLNSAIGRTQTDIDAHITSGLGARAIAEELQNQGLQVDTNLFVIAARLENKANSLKAGRYLIPEGISTLELVHFLSEGKGVLSSIALVEGKTVSQYLEQLRAKGDLRDDLTSSSLQALAQQFDVEGASLEGWIYPDTYRYAPGSTISSLIARGVKLQKQELLGAWGNRSRDSQLKSPYEALIMASIIEKETGQASERPRISSVFNNRLKRGMLLQTDPTVIYGVGEAFDGNLTRKHLVTDTPYNTYTRPGLPPTPITNPGKASLYAATRPEDTDFLYFVAKGDGTSYFSKSLREHNNAVRRYQLRR